MIGVLVGALLCLLGVHDTYPVAPGVTRCERCSHLEAGRR